MSDENCRGCVVLAVRTDCQHCCRNAWGNGRSCWKCHDAIAHRPRTGMVGAATRETTEADITAHYQPGF